MDLREPTGGLFFAVGGLLDVGQQRLERLLLIPLQALELVLVGRVGLASRRIHQSV